MTVSSRMAVMDSGTIVQVGTPLGVYEYPVNRYVAEFIGAVNILEGRVVERRAEGLLIHAPREGIDLLIEHSQLLPDGTPVNVALRPEKLLVSEQPPADGLNFVRGVVSEFAYLGDISIYHVRLPGGQEVRVQLTNRKRLTESPLTWDQEVCLTWLPGSGVVLPA